MTDDRRDTMVVFRMPQGLRDRLRRAATREQRSVSSMAVRAIELGLDEIDKTGIPYGNARERGDAFERAVLSVLVTHGLLAALPDVEPEARPIKRAAGKKKASR